MLRLHGFSKNRSKSFYLNLLNIISTVFHSPLNAVSVNTPRINIDKHAKATNWNSGFWYFWLLIMQNLKIVTAKSECESVLA